MLKVYLAGEIHTNWREEIIENCKKENLDIQFSSPVTDHPSSDDCGVEILGPEESLLSTLPQEWPVDTEACSFCVSIEVQIPRLQPKLKRQQ